MNSYYDNNNNEVEGGSFIDAASRVSNSTLRDNSQILNSNGCNPMLTRSFLLNNGQANNCKMIDSSACCYDELSNYRATEAMSCGKRRSSRLSPRSRYANVTLHKSVVAGSNSHTNVDLDSCLLYEPSEMTNADEDGVTHRGGELLDYFSTHNPPGATQAWRDFRDAMLQKVKESLAPRQVATTRNRFSSASSTADSTTTAGSPVATPGTMSYASSVVGDWLNMNVPSDVSIANSSTLAGSQVLTPTVSSDDSDEDHQWFDCEAEVSSTATGGTGASGSAGQAPHGRSAAK